MELRSKKSVAVVIPMYNEEKNAAKCIDSVVKEIKKLPYKIKLITVNDGSSDNTLKILRAKKRIYKNFLTVHSYQKNRGYGKALQEGIRKADREKFDYVLFMDSDLTNNPSDIKLFLDKLSENPDCIKASRFIKGGSMAGIPFRRKAISVTSNLIIKRIFNLNISDCTNGFRMVRLSKIKKIKFHENSFPIILEELYYLKKTNSKVLEVPVVLRARKNTKSHFSYNPITFYNYGKYAIKALFV